ncbi:aromatic ring-hydroxylating oxygenase subunit alpha [Sphingomonas sp. RIT328]|uniref:aromatic ring-hydroxylating oxygenase subunit alpha n=1 Tax=Sphingomonas sp. RIT328 TaxID=1470591 RepID=UPI00044D716E|nr:Rieske 2Fe-2S domain-containing protein [Sphingomonas sp. RIT328]EZP55129.1 Rieske (2Fe-2S) domain-containing protein [Sphingomonas sp. RIT328]
MNSFDDASVRLWNENWHLLAHRSELAEARDFVRFDILGREVVLYHDGASVIAFDNRCPHRGARIFDGDAGRERFLCRYHGWSYAKGRVFVADKASLTHCSLDQISLKTLQIAWVGDYAFVSPAPARSLEEQMSGLVPMLETMSYGITARWDFNRYLYESDWRIALENALEPYHVSAIHPETLATLKLTPGENQYFGYNSIWSSPLGDERMVRRMRSLSRLFDLPHQFEGYESLYLFPFTMISSTFGFSQSIQHFLPSSIAERTHFTSRLFAGRLRASTKPELVAPFISSSAAMNRAVFEEDHSICQRVPADTWSMDPPRFWSASEEKLIHFRRSYREAVSTA